MTYDRAQIIADAADGNALADKATPGPWSIESCGEKGDGANMVGVAFGPKDMNAEHPLSGWLRPFDDDGNEIEYYRDELVAECDHANRNAGHDAAFIADARTRVPALVNHISTLLARVDELEQQMAEADWVIAEDYTALRYEARTMAWPQWNSAVERSLARRRARQPKGHPDAK